MKFCVSCGSAVPDEAEFCPNCGAADPVHAPVDTEVKKEEIIPDKPAVTAEAAAEDRYAAAMLGDVTRRAEPAPAPAEDTERNVNGMAIAGFVFSLLPIPIICSGIIGLILSIIANKRAKTDLYRDRLEGLALAGKIISIVRLAVTVLLILLAVAAVAFMAYLHKNGLELRIRNLWE